MTLSCPAVCRGLVTAAVLVTAGGWGTPVPVVAAEGRERDAAAVTRKHQSIRQRTRTRFARGAFLSPSPDSRVDLPLYRATLIVEDLGPADEPSHFTRFGRLAVDDQGRLDVDTRQLTMYLLVNQISFGRRNTQQHLALWFYPADAADGLPRYRGVRTILDERGFGVLWEVFSSDQPLRIFYVSKRTERAARTAFGPPLPGRAFSAEPSLDEHPDVLVARLVGEGPQSMGPFVYLGRSALEVVNVLCRCEPSGADAFPQSTHYRLVAWPPLARWSKPYHRLREQLTPRLDEDLTRVLRLAE